MSAHHRRTKTGKRALTEREQHEVNLIYLTASHQLLQRRLRYMSRNTDNSFTVRDLMLGAFAVDVAKNLMEDAKNKLQYCDVKNMADERYKVTTRLRELATAASDSAMTPADKRDNEEEQVILTITLRKLAYGSIDAEEDIKAAERAEQRRKSGQGYGRLAFVEYNERAVREDLKNGENQDFLVIKRCFREMAKQMAKL